MEERGNDDGVACSGEIDSTSELSVAVFAKNCLEGLQPNYKKISENLNSSLMLATVLNRELGYETVAKIVFKAHSEDKTLKQAALELNLMDEESFDKIVNPKKMVGLDG